MSFLGQFSEPLREHRAKAMHQDRAGTGSRFSCKTHLLYQAQGLWMGVARTVHGRHHANRGHWGPAPRLLPELLLHGKGRGHLQLGVTCSIPSMPALLLAVAVAVAAEGDSWPSSC